MANEFGGLSLECIGSQLVPNGDGYPTTTDRAYTVAGAGQDGMFMIGDDYMRQSYSFQLCKFGAALES
uniref:CDR ABC transporter domain-containing protein n=1 Tax=Bionectria ochroleuca TaxID=29856 RepID=A0A8H7K5T9_BIOOC